PQPTMIYFLANQFGTNATPSLNLKSIAPPPIPKGDNLVSLNGSPQDEKTQTAQTPVLNPLLFQQLSQSGKGLYQLAPPPVAGISHLRFDPHQVTLRNDHGAWKLNAGTHLLANFGADGQQAHRALELVQHYNCTEQCRVGLPAPSFS